MRFIQLLVGGMIFSLLFSYQAKGQANWTADEKEKYALLTDTHIDTQDSEEALEWLLDHNPDLHENIYIAGIKLYKERLENLQDPAEKVLYYDELMELYNLRLAYFGRDREVVSRKASDAYLLGRDLESRNEFKLVLFDTVFNELKSSISPNLLAAYMDVAKHAYEDHLIEKEGVIDRYFKINEVLSGKSEEKSEIEKYQLIVDKLFLAAVKLDCNGIESIFSRDIDENKTDISRVKFIVKLSIELGCTSSDIFKEALSLIYLREPSVNYASFLAKTAEANSEFERAEQLYQDMISMADSDEQKSEAYLDLAKFYQRRGDKIRSRTQIRNALKVNSDNKNAYDLLGYLYFYSAEQCKKEINRVEDRCVYLLAYDYFRKAGNMEMMKASEAQFPSMESIHQETFSKEDEIICGCWINEKTTIRARRE